MTKFITAATLTVLLASPVFAKSPAPKQPQPLRGLYMSADQTQVVIREGRVIGQDPDPNVRLQILRDYGG